MQTQTLQITKWPFYTANAVLNLTAVLLVLVVPSFSFGVALLFVMCAGLGALLLAAPFLMEYRARVQAHGIEARSRVNANEARFEQWASDLKEQTQYLAELTEQIENNMFATEGMVRRADRKLAALEKFESKMDQVLGGGSIEGFSASSAQYSSLRSVENEPLFTQATSSTQDESDIDLSLFNGASDLESEIEGDGAGFRKSGSVGHGGSAGERVMFQEHPSFQNNEGKGCPSYAVVESMLNCDLTGDGSSMEQVDKLKEEDACGLSVLDMSEDFVSSMESDDEFADVEEVLEMEDVQIMEERNEEEVSSVLAANLEPAVSAKVRVSAKSGRGRKKSAVAKSDEMSLFPEESDEDVSVVAGSAVQEETSSEFDDEEEFNLNVRASEGVDGVSEAQEAPESAYTMKVSDAGQTVVIANVMIGLGNKPFMRGEGGGLSWEKGKAMEFLEIGKWGYTFEKVSKNMEFRIFKNDKEADEYLYRVKEGQVMEVSPKFAVKQMSGV